MNPGLWRDSLNYSENDRARWYRGGPELFDHMVEMIRSAESEIHLQVYIIDPDVTGMMILNELMIAAQRGVAVNLVVDDFGSDKLDSKDATRLIATGINFRRFEPFLSTNKYYVGRRMHHKVLVVDQKQAIVGGMNIADRYRGTATDPPWLDYAVHVEGIVCKELANVCRTISDKLFRPGPPKFHKRFLRKKSLDPARLWIRTRKNDWLRNYREITISYNNSVRMATRSICIVGGYFLPGRKFLRLLSNASKRGVEIKIILTSFSDSVIVRHASEYLYDRLFREKIRIYEAKNTMVHGKAAIVDETWSTIGSYNQNHLSAYISIEMNIDIVNRDFSTSFAAHLKEVIENECTEITEESFHRKSTIPSKLIRWASYQFVRISLRMLFTLNRIFEVND